MPDPSGTQLLAPAINIVINGKPLPNPAEADLMTVTVSEDLDAADMFKLELVSWDMVNGKVTWADDSLFAPGNEVKIQMGYGNQLKTLILGEITALEPEFAKDAVPTLIVRGHDQCHRLMRTRKTLSFTKTKDSQIVSKIARAVGLSAKVEDTQVQLDYVLQHNQTDWEFLKERALRIGYEVVVANKTLHFRKPQNTTQKVLTLNGEKDLISFSPRLSTMNQVDRVEVRSWNSKQKKMFTGKADAGKIVTMGSSSSGPKASKNAFGAASLTIVNQPVYSQQEADKIAEGLLNDMAIAYITGDGTCFGRPDLRAGKVIEIIGIGKRFSGCYYVTSATHTYSQDQGYTTTFTVRRNAT